MLLRTANGETNTTSTSGSDDVDEKYEVTMNEGSSNNDVRDGINQLASLKNQTHSVFTITGTINQLCNPLHYPIGAVLFVHGVSSQTEPFQGNPY